MLEVFDVPVNGTTFKLREFSFKQAREHVAEGRNLIAQGDKVTPEEWYDRTIATVAAQLVDPQLTTEQIGEEMSKRSVEKLYNRLLEVSGLRMAPEGEGKAV